MNKIAFLDGYMSKQAKEGSILDENGELPDTLPTNRPKTKPVIPTSIAPTSKDNAKILADIAAKRTQNNKVPTTANRPLVNTTLPNNPARSTTRKGITNIYKGDKMVKQVDGMNKRFDKTVNKDMRTVGGGFGNKHTARKPSNAGGHQKVTKQGTTRVN